MENNYINLNYMADREKDITIKDLKTAIRKYKREECKPYYQLNRAGLIEYVKQYEIPVKIAKKTKKTKKETKPKPKTILKVKPVKQDKPPRMDQPIEEVDVPKINIPQISKPVKKRVPIKVKETGTAHLKKKSPKKTVERKKLTREEEAIIKEQERNRREEKEEKEREEKERNKQKKRNEKEEEERKAKAIKAFQEAEKLKESDRKKKRAMMTQQEKDADDYERKREKREEKSRAKYVSKADRDAEEKREKEKKEQESKKKREEAKKRMGIKTEQEKEDEEIEEMKKKLEEFRKKRAKEKEKEPDDFIKKIVKSFGKDENVLGLLTQILNNYIEEGEINDDKSMKKNRAYNQLKKIFKEFLISGRGTGINFGGTSIYSREFKREVKRFTDDIDLILKNRNSLDFTNMEKKIIDDFKTHLNIRLLKKVKENIEKEK